MAKSTQCAIEHWGGECRDVTTSKLVAVSKYPKTTVGGNNNNNNNVGRVGGGGGGGGSGWM